MVCIASNDVMVGHGITNPFELCGWVREEHRTGVAENEPLYERLLDTIRDKTELDKYVQIPF